MPAGPLTAQGRTTPVRPITPTFCAPLMTTTHIEPGISAIRDSSGRTVGYMVDGVTRTWRTLRAARAAQRRL